MKKFQKYITLFCFYFCQGLPFGFFLYYLPLEMRGQNWNATKISFWSVILGFPWVCKFLWSPIVDTYYHKLIGRRRSWILPLILALMLGCTNRDKISQALYINGDLVLDYQPRSNLVRKQPTPCKPKYPVIDVHTHFSSDLSPAFLIEKMDELGIEAIINLSGGYGEKLEKMLEKFSHYDPHRFIIFCNLDFSKIDDPDFSEQMVEFLRAAHAKGAKGLKIFKNLGLTVKDKTGQIVAIDDIRFDPIWAKAGELGMPVLIHSADPVAFFKPTDRFNERLMQLKRHPDWSFSGADFPERETVIAQRNRVIARHPNTIFIGAHVGNSSEDLIMLGKLLDSYPNLYVDVAGRVAELGRQPYTARKFFIKYQDRILFGTDRYPGKAVQPRYKIYYRFLQTEDEYFNYYDHPFPPAGEWKIYGVFLPDEVLEKIYFKNAQRVLGLRLWTVKKGDKIANPVNSTRSLITHFSEGSVKTPSAAVLLFQNKYL